MTLMPVRQQSPAASSLRLPPRAVPVRVVPFPQETPDSFVSRLAAANHTNADSLRRYITGRSARDRLPTNMLAAATGIPAEILCRALPGLAGGQRPQLYGGGGITVSVWIEAVACQLCAAARGGLTPVRVTRPHERVVCLPHRRWLGWRPSDSQLSLISQPEILQAHKRHLRLTRRAGRVQSALAVAASLRVFRRGHRSFTEHEDLDRRLELFGDSGRNVARWDDPMVDAAEYPEVIEFARILASRHWRRLALSDALTEQRRFGAEVRRAALPDFEWPQTGWSLDAMQQTIAAVGAVTDRLT
jgi:hypothetical protein